VFDLHEKSEYVSVFQAGGEPDTFGASIRGRGASAPLVQESLEEGKAQVTGKLARKGKA
jgi:hypothetical protein